jgi:hypothetical protein
VLFEFDPAGGRLVPAAGAGGLTVTGVTTGAGAAGAAGAEAAGAPAATRAGGLGM